MKKSVSVFLLAIFLFNTAGIFALFSYLKHEHYESVFKRGADKKNLSWLTIPKTENIHWEKKDEIIYKGKYYDIFQKSEDEKNLYLLCYMDSKEEKMAETFHKHLDGQQSQSANGKQGSNTVTKPAIQDFEMQNFSWAFQETANKNYNCISFSCLSGFTSCFSPPPEAV